MWLQLLVEMSPTKVEVGTVVVLGVDVAAGVYEIYVVETGTSSVIETRVVETKFVAAGMDERSWYFLECT